MNNFVGQISINKIRRLLLRWIWYKLSYRQHTKISLEICISADNIGVRIYRSVSNSNQSYW